ncbi:hypothetical protein EVAR_62425_1 [Eumeta japonica]|uniref:Uncharacterized protein n=1 Tax=Eumeta variegata TaxID=151549 RepID=A0A4C1Z3Q8_EUMVA|nr:hypothetical protein EVAR_62425_1 [Eumeta japonica]
MKSREIRFIGVSRRFCDSAHTTLTSEGPWETASAGAIGLRCDVTDSYQCRFVTDRGCAKRITGQSPLRHVTHTSAVLRFVPSFLDTRFTLFSTYMTANVRFFDMYLASWRTTKENVSKERRRDNGGFFCDFTFIMSIRLTQFINKYNTLNINKLPYYNVFRTPRAVTFDDSLQANKKKRRTSCRTFFVRNFGNISNRSANCCTTRRVRTPLKRNFGFIILRNYISIVRAVGAGHYTNSGSMGVRRFVFRLKCVSNERTAEEGHIENSEKYKMRYPNRKVHRRMQLLEFNDGWYNEIHFGWIFGLSLFNFGVLFARIRHNDGCDYNNYRKT